MPVSPLGKTRPQGHENVPVVVRVGGVGKAVEGSLPVHWHLQLLTGLLLVSPVGFPGQPDDSCGCEECQWAHEGEEGRGTVELNDVPASVFVGLDDVTLLLLGSIFLCLGGSHEMGVAKLVWASWVTFWVLCSPGGPVHDCLCSGRSKSSPWIGQRWRRLRSWVDPSKSFTIYECSSSLRDTIVPFVSYNLVESFCTNTLSPSSRIARGLHFWSLIDLDFWRAEFRWLRASPIYSLFIGAKCLDSTGKLVRILRCKNKRAGLTPACLGVFLKWASAVEIC